LRPGLRVLARREGVRRLSALTTEYEG
jgi:hypothetical protein